jgi:hypothetical protein
VARSDGSSAVALIHLQRSAGNAAVTRMLQRYEAGEHAKQGDHAAGSKTVKVGTESLTSGEVNALADLYGSPDDLIKADPAELSAVVALVRRQVAGGSVPEAEWDKATGGRYTKLNLKNSPHFGPRNPALVAPPAGVAAGEDNRSKFLAYFAETVDHAQRAFEPAAQADPAKAKELLDHATISAGFAEHYLMDAFSAGHLFNKDDFMAKLKTNLDALPKDKLAGLFDTVAKGVLADKASKDLLDKFETVDTHYGFHPNFSRDAALKGLLEKLYADPDGRQAMYSGLVKVVHDDLSTRDAGGGLVGVEVENATEKWVLSGDKTLDKSPKTQLIIDQALEQFRQLIAPYRAGHGAPASGAPNADKVTAFFPRPTAASATMIADLITKVTDPARETGKSLIAILKAELPAVLEQLVARKLIRRA